VRVSVSERKQKRPNSSVVGAEHALLEVCMYVCMVQNNLCRRYVYTCMYARMLSVQNMLC